MYARTSSDDASEAERPVVRTAPRVAPTFSLANVPVTAPIQRKKTTQPAAAGLIKKFTTGHNLPKAVLNGKVTETDQADAIWTFLGQRYEADRKGGKEKLDELEKDIVRYKDVQTKSDVVNDNTLKRTGYDQRFKDRYPTSFRSTGKLNEAKYGVNSQGHSSASNSPKIPPIPTKGNYKNEFDLDTGEIKAAWNFGAERNRDTGDVHYYDEALENKEGLNNSEILWQQAQFAARRHHKSAVNVESAVATTLKKISKITRSTVINDETKETVYMAFPDGKDWESDSLSVSSGDDLHAILGTPNAKSSIFFLKDHLDQLEKTIDHVDAAYSDIEIHFKPI